MSRRLGFLVAVVVPHWMLFALAQAVGETVAAIALILGLAARWAGVLGLLLAANLALTVSRGPLDLSVYAGVREWPYDTGALDAVWAGGTAAWWRSHRGCRASASPTIPTAITSSWSTATRASSP